ncbi:MAG TPA: prolyl oligopeptidase family serine peptidase [Terriglobales bacterium]|nr:prolyl oligopeptidase family serine peptidase [Terriglobales bacterium]
MIRRQLFFPALLLLLCVSAAAQQTPAFPTSEDLRHFRGLADPRLSPDGKQVLYRVTEAAADGGTGHLWLTDLAANTSRQITFSPPSDKGGERSAEWMPDGSILFLAKRGEHTQLFRLPAQFGEAKPFDLKVLPLVDITRQPTYIDTSAKKSEAALEQPAAEKPAEKKEEADPRQPINVSSYAIAPNGKWVAVVAEDPPSPAETKQKTDKADAIWVNHDLHGRRLYLLDPASGKLTDTSVPPNVSAVSWTADSARMLVITGPQNELDDLGPQEKAYVLQAAHPDQPSLLDKMPPTIGSAAWSRDAASIYFVAQARRDAPPGVADLYQFDFATQQTHNLTDGFAGAVGRRPIPLLNGGVLNGAGTGVQTTAMVIRSGQAPEVLRFPTPLAGFFDTNERQSGWVYIGDGSTQPLTLYYTDSLARPPHAIATPKLTPANDRTVQSKRISYRSENFNIEGLLYLPPQAANGKVPLIVDVHGGPTGAFQDAYDPFVGWLNGQGWAVFRANIRGSSNYGAEFAAANKNDLGGGDYRDLMAGVDYVLNNYPLDENRMALMGYSYGGEMAGFVEGKTNRFKAIISGAPVIDQFSEYGTENGSWYDRWFYGRPWEHFEDAWRQSPLSGAAKASTPFLLLQGAADKTDPLGESQQMYRALRQMGVPVELVIYPRDDHGPLAGAIYGRPVSEPWHGIDARRHIQTFLQKAFGETK